MLPASRQGQVRGTDSWTGHPDAPGWGVGWALPSSIWSVSFLHGNHWVPVTQPLLAQPSTLGLLSAPGWDCHLAPTHLQVPEGLAFLLALATKS